MTDQARPGSPIAATAGPPLENRTSVFISYRHVDREVAGELYELLVKRNVSAWYDPLIQYGTDWREAIVEHLSAARVMVILLSPASFESEELKKELAVAAQERVPLLAVRLQDVKPPGAFAYELARVHWFDLFVDPPARLAALVDLLEKIASEPREADLDSLLRDWLRRWRTTMGRRAGFLNSTRVLVTLHIFLSVLVFLFYESNAEPLKEMTDGGTARWIAWRNVAVASTIGSPLLLLSALLRERGVGVADLPLLAATAANTIVLLLLARNFLNWIRLRWLAARRSP